MKILHISRGMGQGGVEKMVYQFCKDNTLQEQIVISKGGQYVEQLDKLGVKHYLMPDMDKKNPILMLRCFIAIYQVVKHENIEIMHSHHRMGAFYARIIATITGTRCVYTSHNVFYNKRSLSRMAFKNSKIIAVGDGVKKNLIEVFKIPEERIQVIYNAVEVYKTGELNPCLDNLKKEGKYIIGTIGRISEQKGMDVFLKAMAPVIHQDKNVIAVIIGDGEDRNKMEQLVRELGIVENVIFLGIICVQPLDNSLQDIQR